MRSEETLDQLIAAVATDAAIEAIEDIAAASIPPRRPAGPRGRLRAAATPAHAPESVLSRLLASRLPTSPRIIFRVLGELGGPRIVEQVVAALPSLVPAHRVGAVLALGTIGGRAAVQALAEIAADSTSEEQLRELALDALEGLALAGTSEGSHGGAPEPSEHVLTAWGQLRSKDAYPFSVVQIVERVGQGVGPHARRARALLAILLARFTPQILGGAGLEYDLQPGTSGQTASRRDPTSLDRRAA